METEIEKPKSSKGLTIFLIVVILGLTAAIVVLYSKMGQQKEESAVVQEALEQQKEMLRTELTDLNGQYDGLKSNNDSMNQLIGKQQEKIKKLLGERASNAELIVKYKKELSTLREVLKSYIAQVDSLNTKNMQLVQENTEVKTNLDQARTENIKLNEEKSQLSTQVQKAKVLSAANIIVTPLNKRGKEEDNAGKTLKIKTCFVIRENATAEAGNKDVYVRITRPDGAVLAISESDVFDFQGQQIVYSAKRVVEYENKDIEVCIFWDNTQNQLMLGDYTVDIFAEGNMIGTSKFNIKKK
jgi:FtsZ-binding cell division protein ZapB